MPADSMARVKEARTWLGSNKPQPVEDKANPDFISL
jgi:hypothetical protein